MKNQPSFFKQAVTILLAAVMIFTLPACGGSEDTRSGGTDTRLEDTPSSDEPASSESLQEEAPAKTTYSTQGISFDVPTGWTQAEGMDMFYSPDQRKVCGLNGVSLLGSYTPQEFYEELCSYYQSSGQFDSLDVPEGLSSRTYGDDVSCQVADLVGYQGSVIICTRVVISPQKNMVLTFSGQAYDDGQYLTEVQYMLNFLCESLTFEIGTQDYISGNTFLCNDGSQLCLRDDSSFRYYQSADDHENQYYEGVYEVYRGQAAMEKIASMTEYGLTMEELEQVLAANMNGYIPGGSKPSDYFYALGELEDDRTYYDVCLDTFYAVILNNQRLVHSPDDVEEGGNSTLYLGFYIPELNMADLTNANAASYTQWTFQEKTV